MLKLSAMLGGGASSEPAAAGPSEDGKVSCLRDISNITRQRLHPLRAPLVIVGRKAEEPVPTGVEYLLIRQVVVGRKHATLERKEDGIWLTDCDSVNGTFLNGERLTSSVRLKSGDVLRFYEYEFEFLEDLSAADFELARKEAQRGQGAAGQSSGRDDDDTLLYL